MYLHNNLKFDINIARTLGAVQYPRGWFLDADNRAAQGIIEVPDPVKPDPELFTYVENPDGSLTSTPRTSEDIAARQAAAALALQAQIEADALNAERLGLAAQIEKLTLAIDQYQALLDVPYAEPAQAGTTALEITALRARMRNSERGARDIWRDLISTMKAAKYLLRQSRRGI